MIWCSEIPVVDMVINLCGKKVMFMSYGKKPYLDSMGIGITKCDKKDYNV